jgi:hypothetical protein
MAIGETSDIMTLNAQFAHVATLVPIDRVRVGKTYAHGSKCERSRDKIAHLRCQHPANRAKAEREHDTHKEYHGDTCTLSSQVRRVRRREASDNC